MNGTLVKTLYSYLLAIALIGPMVLQLEHVISTDHQSSYCAIPNDLHIDDHEMDCMPFHHQIDHSSISFASGATHVNKPVDQGAVVTADQRIDMGLHNSCPSRAPPISLV